MKKANHKIILLAKITFFIFIILSSTYLKYKNFLCSIDFSNITPYFDDKMLFNIEYNVHQNTLIIFSMIILILYLVIYYLKKTKHKVELYDKVYLFYFIINFLVNFLPKYSISTNGDAQQLAILLSSLTFLQVNFINIIPYGCIVYIPLIYLFFIKKEKGKS
jgi:hypothetical protein